MNGTLNVSQDSDPWSPPLWMLLLLPLGLLLLIFIIAAAIITVRGKRSLKRSRHGSLTSSSGLIQAPKWKLQLFSKHKTRPRDESSIQTFKHPPYRQLSWQSHSSHDDETPILILPYLPPTDPPTSSSPSSSLPTASSPASTLSRHEECMPSVHEMLQKRLSEADGNSQSSAHEGSSSSWSFQPPPKQKSDIHSPGGSSECFAVLQQFDDVINSVTDIEVSKTQAEVALDGPSLEERGVYNMTYEESTSISSIHTSDSASSNNLTTSLIAKPEQLQSMQINHIINNGLQSPIIQATATLSKNSKPKKTPSKIKPESSLSTLIRSDLSASQNSLDKNVFLQNDGEAGDSLEAQGLDVSNQIQFAFQNFVPNTNRKSSYGQHQPVLIGYF